MTQRNCAHAACNGTCSAPLCEDCGRTRLSWTNTHETLCRNCSGENDERAAEGLSLLLAVMARFMEEG
jgi:hypothetical protein